LSRVGRFGRVRPGGALGLCVLIILKIFDLNFRFSSLFKVSEAAYHLPKQHDSLLKHRCGLLKHDSHLI